MNMSWLDFLIVIVVVALLAYGLGFLMAQRLINRASSSKKNVSKGLTTSNTTSAFIKTEEPLSPDPDLDVFLQDISSTYSLIAKHGMYIRLEALKGELPSKYHQDKFDILLILARQRFPNKIWIDKDSQGHTIVKIVP